MRKSLIIGLLAVGFVLSPTLISAQTSPTPGGGGGGGSPSILQQIYTLLDVFTEHHSNSEINRLQNQILRLLINLLAQSSTIPPTTPAISFVVTAPNGGESWQKGTIQSIEWRWTSTDVAPVEIYLHSASTGGSCPIGQNCPVSAASYLIGKVNVPTTIFKWNVGKAWDGAVIPAGPYIVQIRAPAPDGSSLWKDQSDSYFKIYDSGQPGNLPPVISGISGPTTLKISESGTWTVQASDPENGPLSYSVIWGDEGMSGGSGGGGGTASASQTATFTHSYTIAGNYTPTFTVTDNSGQSARTSLSVVVGGGTQLTYNISTATYGDGSGMITKNPNQDNYLSGTSVALTAIPMVNSSFIGWSGDCSGISSFCTLIMNANKNVVAGFSVIPPPQPAPTIVSSFPPNNAVDARGVARAGDATGPWTITLYASGPTSGYQWNNVDFSVSSTRTDLPSISVTGVNAYSNWLGPTLSRNIEPGERITLTHKPSNYSVCLGFKPGDVDGDGRFLARDISGLRSWIGTDIGLKQPLYKTDINRDGVFNEADVTRLSELGQSLISPILLPACPAPAMGGGAFAPVSDQAQMANTLSALQSLLQNLKQFLAR